MKNKTQMEIELIKNNLNQIQYVKEDLQTGIKKLIEINEDCEANWQGIDADIFNEKMNQFIEKINKFENSINDVKKITKEEITRLQKLI